MIGLEPRSGSYALLCIPCTTGEIQIGKLGTLDLQPGYYVYVGSAFGPGGVRARIMHHIQRSSRPHWHIDYLKPHCTLEEIWVEYSEMKQESVWVERLSNCVRSSTPLIGFGASDGRADAHLFHFNSRPAVDLLHAHHPLRIER